MAASSQAGIALRELGPRSKWQRSLRATWSFARSQPLGALSAVVLVVLVLTAIFADAIAPYPPNKNNPTAALSSPSLNHLAGTDQFGRDIFSRVVMGARLSLYVGLTASGVAIFFAVLLGLIGAYFGGAIDSIIQRAVEVVQAFPGLILLLFIVGTLGNSTFNVIMALAFGGIWGASRVVRASVLSVMANTYVEAARVVGCSNTRIMRRHLLPNIVPMVIIMVSISVGGVILAEAGLSFLGFGVPPPAATWGRMMSVEGRSFMFVAPWILIAPTIALSLVVYAFNMFGDALREKLDPRMRGGR